MHYYIYMLQTILGESANNVRDNINNCINSVFVAHWELYMGFTHYTMFCSTIRMKYHKMESAANLFAATR